MDWIAVAEWCRTTAMEMARTGRTDGIDQIRRLFDLSRHMIALDPHTRLGAGA